eukprot:jgi/Chlat1/2864/Chrsp195S03016
MAERIVDTQTGSVPLKTQETVETEVPMTRTVEKPYVEKYMDTETRTVMRPVEEVVEVERERTVMRPETETYLGKQTNVVEREFVQPVEQVTIVRAVGAPQAVGEKVVATGEPVPTERISSVPAGSDAYATTTTTAYDTTETYGTDTTGTTAYGEEPHKKSLVQKAKEAVTHTIDKVTGHKA